MEITGIVLSLLPLILWGAGDFAGSISSSRTSPITTSFAFTIVGLPVPIVLCALFGFPEFSMKYALVYTLAGLMFTVAFALMLYGFSKVATGIVAPIANSYALFTLIFAVVFFDEVFTSLQIVGMLIVVVGVVLSSIEKSADSIRKNALFKGIVAALFASLIFGTAFSILSTVNSDITWYQNQLFLSLGSLVSGSVLFFAMEKQQSIKLLRKALRMPQTIFGGLAGNVGALGFFGAAEVLGTVVIPSVIASAAPLVTAIIAHRVHHEKLQLQQRVGTICIVLGIIVLNIG